MIYPEVQVFTCDCTLLIHSFTLYFKDSRRNKFRTAFG